MEATILGKNLHFPQGRAFPRLGGVHVVLSSQPTSCAEPGALNDAAAIEFDVPPGPRGDFFASAPIGVEAWFHDPERSTAQGRAAPWQTTVKLDAAPDDRVRGTIDFATKLTGGEATARGTFDVELCDRAALTITKANALPAASDAAITGTLGGDAFTPRTVLASVWKDPSSGEAFVHSLAFYPSTGVDCVNHFVFERAEPVVVLEEIGGVSERRTLGGMQPAEALYSKPERPNPDAAPTATLHALGSGRRAWVRFDDLNVGALKQGQTVKGAAAAASDPGAPAADVGHLDGTFTATVCAQ